MIKNKILTLLQIKNKINVGEKNPVVTRLDAWEYARSNANGVANDPATLQVLEDVVIIILPVH